MRWSLSVMTLTSALTFAVQASDEQLQKMNDALRVGMSLEDVRKLSPKTGNCKGSPKSYMVCEGVFRRDGNSYASAAALTMMAVSGSLGSPNPTKKYEKLSLHFNDNKLQRWESESEIR